MAPEQWGRVGMRKARLCQPPSPVLSLPSLPGRCPGAESSPVHREPAARSPARAAGASAAAAPRGPGPLRSHPADRLHPEIHPPCPRHRSLLPTRHRQRGHRGAPGGDAVRDEGRAAGPGGTRALLSSSPRLGEHRSAPGERGGSGGSAPASAGRQGCAWRGQRGCCSGSGAAALQQLLVSVSVAGCSCCSRTDQARVEPRPGFSSRTLKEPSVWVCC